MNLERSNWTLDPGRDWHVSWFRECLRMVDTFTHQDSSWRDEINNAATFKTHTNLCHYIRTTALWGPGIIALQLLTFSLILGAVIFMPIKALGVAGYIMLLTTLIVVAGFVFGVYKGVEWSETTGAGRRFNNFVDKLLFRPVRTAGHATAEKLSFRSPEGVSFWSMVWTNIVTLKHQVCPLINIKEAE